LLCGFYSNYRNWWKFYIKSSTTTVKSRYGDSQHIIVAPDDISVIPGELLVEKKRNEKLFLDVTASSTTCHRKAHAFFSCKEHFQYEHPKVG
jgi:hypothetical protein